MRGIEEHEKAQAGGAEKAARKFFAKLLARPIAQIGAVWGANRLPADWRAGFREFAFGRTAAKLSSFAVAVWALQLAGLGWYLYLFLTGAITPSGLAGRVAFSAAFLAGVQIMLRFTISDREEGSGAVAEEYGVMLFMIAVTLGQVANAALDVNDTLIIYRMVITAVIIAILPEARTERTLATTLVLYGVIGAAVIAMRPVGHAAPAAHLPAMLFAVIGAEFVCFFFRANVVDTYVHQRKMVAAAAKLEETNHRLREMNGSLEKLSVTDQLTQVANRRSFDQYIERAWGECRRLEKALTVMIMDIDHFKAFNDYYGHLEGDECLKTVAETAAKHFNRSVDLFARYGGEEFVAVLPFTTGSSALKLAEAVRADVEALRIPNPNSTAAPYVTLSIGVAGRVPAGGGHEEIVEQADRALYNAKADGRNCVSSDIESDHAIAHREDLANGREFARLWSAFRMGGATVFTLELESGTLEFARELAHLIGVEKRVFEPFSEFMGFVHEDDRGAFERSMRGLQTDGAIYEPRIRILQPSAAYIPVKLSAVRLETGFGERWAFGTIRVLWDESEGVDLA